MFLKNIETHVHPVTDDLLGYVLGEKVRDRAASNRVRTHAGRTLARFVSVHRLARLRVAVVGALLCVDTSDELYTQAVQRRISREIRPSLVVREDHLKRLHELTSEHAEETTEERLERTRVS